MTQATKTTTAKAANYTDAMVTEITTAMQAVKSHTDQVAAIIMLASSTGKTIRSLTAKISNLSRSDDSITFYGKEKAVSKTGQKVESKANKITRLAGMLSVDESVVESLEKGTKQGLDAVLNGIDKLRNEIDGLEEEGNEDK